jgi:hypothetical protein
MPAEISMLSFLSVLASLGLVEVRHSLLSFAIIPH